MFFRSRISSLDDRDEKLAAACRDASERFPGRVQVVVCDAPMPLPPGVGCLFVKHEASNTLSVYDPANTIFIYAVDQDDIGERFIKECIELGYKFLPIFVCDPISYPYMNRVARFVLEEQFQLQHTEGFDKWDFGPDDFVNLIQAIEMTRNLQGAYVEIGCYRGSSGSVAMHYMKSANISRSAFFLDVFDGFEYDAAHQSMDAFWSGTHKTEGQQIVERRLKRYDDVTAGLVATVCKRNIITDDLDESIGRIVVANVDVDMYEAVAASLDKLKDRIVPGGIIIAEDAGHTPLLIGARLALTEFIEKNQVKFTSIYMQSGQTFLIRK